MLEDEENLKIIDREEVLRFLDETSCIDVMRRTLAGLEAGQGVQYLRKAYPLPDGEIFAFMPAWLDAQHFGAKVLTVFHKNQAMGHPSHQGGVMLFEAAHGSSVALVDAAAITQVRTGAVSAVATDLLARPNAHHLALLGCGVQAQSHLRAIRHVRALHQVTVWDLHADRARAFASHMSEETGLQVLAMDTAQAALANADIVCTLTPAKTPVLAADWIAPGAHINAVGACLPADRELPSALMAKARVYGDARESVLQESGDFLIPLREGAYGEEHLLGTLGGLLQKTVTGREDARQITIFKALGLAIEDIAAARFVYEAALTAKK